MADLADGPSRAARRKFATPPVKLACLSCRSARTRCDGGRPCTSCVAKGNECVYRPSRRGGPRIRKKPASSSPPNGFPPAAAYPPDDSALLPDASEQPVPIQSFIEPGAALGQLPDLIQDSDFLFDSLFPDALPAGVFDDLALPQDLLTAAAAPPPKGPIVRTYRSDYSLLQAYYCWIHPYVPIFPPPETTPPVDEPSVLAQDQPPAHVDFEPSTPVALALSAVLALIPCAEDANPTAAESVLFRRKCAQFFAQAAIEAIEAESEIPASATEPHTALESSPPPVGRAPLHPRVPVELESIIALDLLSVYEYAQRGNLQKMRSRAGQALMDAMMTYSLHTQTDDSDFFAEAKRRVWWVTSSIVSNTPPPLELYGATFTTKYPTLEADPEAWPDFIEAQQAILEATQFVIQLNAVLASQGDMGPIYSKMVELETRVAPLVERSEAWTFHSHLAAPVDPAETCLVRSLRSMARIKLNSARIKVHRYRAFYDVPVFHGRHCDLKSTAAAADGFDLLPWPACSCSSLQGGGSLQGGSSGSGSGSGSGSFTSHAATSGGMCCAHAPTFASSHYDAHDSHSAATTSSSTKTTDTPDSSTNLSSLGSPLAAAAQRDDGAAGTLADSRPLSRATSGGASGSGSGIGIGTGTGIGIDKMTAAVAPPTPPYSSLYSAKICLRSATNIAGGFDGLPYPNPSGQPGLDLCFLSATSPVVAPRMLPSFVCCAMQAAYVFLSVHRKTRELPTLADAGLSGGGGGGSASNSWYLASMLLQLQRGLTSILAALENYSTAFEALRSMRDQVRLSADNLLGLGLS